MKIIIFTFLIFTMNCTYSEIPKEDKNFKKFLPYINQLNEIKNQSDFNDKILCKGDFFSFDVNNQTLNFLGEASLLANNIFISSEQILIKFINNKLNFISQPNSFLKINNKNNNFIEIRSQKIVFNYFDKNINFFGINRFNYEDCLLSCDNANLTLSEDLKPINFEAKSNVIIKMNNFFLSSNFAKFDNNPNKIDLFGNPELKHFQNSITAESISIWPNENQVLCKPNVKMKIYDNF
tara:strand:- start:9 stop:719 length:711 start_codon:yes stop_codon:yes gene_type:complete